MPGESDGASAATVLGDLHHEPGPPGPVTAVVRPEQISVTDAPEGRHAMVAGVEFHGHDRLVRLALADGTPATARVPARQPLQVGRGVGVSVMGRVHVLRDRQPARVHVPS